MWSYCDNVNLCVLADKKVMPDGWKLFNYFVDELQTLVSLVSKDAPQENASPYRGESTDLSSGG